MAMWAKCDSGLTCFKSGVHVCADTEGLSSLPGAESVLSHPLLLQHTGVLQFDRAGYEAHLTALLHQTTDPPVIVVLLHAEQTARHQ